MTITSVEISRVKQTTQYPYHMKADQRSSAERLLDLSPLIGDWINTKTESIYLIRVVLAEQDGRLIFRGYGANDAEPIDWGEVEAIPYAAETSPAAKGFLASYHHSGIERHLVANEKQEILVIQTYSRYLDGSGRSNHFGREFYHRSGGGL